MDAFDPRRRRGPGTAASGALRGWGRLVTAGVRDVARLVLPVDCPGCGRWDEVLCPSCAAVLDGPVRRCEADVPRLDRLDGRESLPVWAVSAYVGPVRGIVVAWKDRGRADLTAVLVGTVRRAALEVGPAVAAAAAGRTVVVVPVPSAPGARRRRGADLVAVLADAVVAGLCEAGVPARRAPLLVRRRSRDQVGLGARARRSNATGSVRLRRAGPVARLAGLAREPGAAPGDPHLLVDDVVTTGSTLAACETVLTASGRFVLGALVVAATPPPTTSG